ncbi:general negative regulator of transcription subunit 3-like isoform X1 [Iris pallida]|nr:general negative regulator of transcription subunit 3-like isoform X1 [Iris pallida]
MNLSSVGGISSNGPLSSIPTICDMAKRNALSADERIGNGGLTPPLVSPLSNRMLLQQVAKSSDGTSSNDFSNVGDGRVFSPSGPAGVQWRPPSTAAFQNQADTTGQFRGRTEIAPDQREKFLQRLQQVQQQGHSTLLSVPHLQGTNHKQFPMQQQNSLLQQFNSQNPSLSPQLGLGLNIQSPGLNSVTSAQLQTPVLQQSSPLPLMSTGTKDADVGQPKGDEQQQQQQQQQQNFADDLNAESATNSSQNKIIGDDDLKSPYTVAGAATIAEGNQLPRDTDLSPGQPLQPSQSSASLGVIGRRSASDLGAIGDNLSGSAGNFGGLHDQVYNLQMLEAAYYKLPQPKDSERAKTYIPRHPAVTPASFPRYQADIVENPAFWERMGLDQMGADALFFAFYYQQNTYQQYLAARELKRQSWRFHRKYNTWFQRHEEPKVTNDEFEKGTYVYFDFHIADDGPQQGWCQRIKTEFTFEYNYLEDELVV